MEKENDKLVVFMLTQVTNFVIVSIQVATIMNSSCDTFIIAQVVFSLLPHLTNY